MLSIMTGAVIFIKPQFDKRNHEKIRGKNKRVLFERLKEELKDEKQLHTRVIINQ